MKAMGDLSRTEVLLENTKRECELLRLSDARVTAERDLLKQDKVAHSSLLMNLESIKASIDRSEAEWKLKMDDKLDSTMKECSALRRRLQDEQDRYTEKLAVLEEQVETLKTRLDDEHRSNEESNNVIQSLKCDIKEKDEQIDELKGYCLQFSLLFITKMKCFNHRKYD
jgi:nucleoprotein TPR